MRLEGDINPKAVHPSLGLGEVPSGYCGALKLQVLEPRNEEEAVIWDSWGYMSAPLREGTRHRAAPVPVSPASTVPDTLVALEGIARLFIQ